MSVSTGGTWQERGDGESDRGLSEQSLRSVQRSEYRLMLSESQCPAKSWSQFKPRDPISAGLDVVAAVWFLLRTSD